MTLDIQLYLPSGLDFDPTLSKITLALICVSELLISKVKLNYLNEPQSSMHRSLGPSFPAHDSRFLPQDRLALLKSEYSSIHLEIELQVCRVGPKYNL